MGLYDDELEVARGSAAYEAARRAVEGLKAPSIAMLASAVDALDAVLREHAALEEDGTFQSWQRQVVAAGRALRSAGGPEWGAFAESHTAFVHRLDVRDGMTKFETSGRFGYELWHPAGWRKHIEGDDSRFAVSPDANFSDAVVVSMKVLTHEATLEERAAEAVAALRHERAGCEIGPRKLRRLDRVDAVEFEFSHAALRARRILAVHGGTEITVTVHADKARFAAFEVAALPTINSIKLKG